MSIDTTLLEPGALITLRARVVSYEPAQGYGTALVLLPSGTVQLAPTGAPCGVGFSPPALLGVDERPLQVGDKVRWSSGVPGAPTGEIIAVRDRLAWVLWPETFGPGEIRNSVNLITNLTRVRDPEPPTITGSFTSAPGPWTQARPQQQDPPGAVHSSPPQPQG